jgi:hypothetical protein
MGRDVLLRLAEWVPKVLLYCNGRLLRRIRNNENIEIEAPLTRKRKPRDAGSQSDFLRSQTD